MIKRILKFTFSKWRIENGTTNPTYKTLEEIADELKKSYEAAGATNTRLVVDFVPIKN